MVFPKPVMQWFLPLRILREDSMVPGEWEDSSQFTKHALHELGFPQHCATPLHADNTNAAIPFK